MLDKVGSCRWLLDLLLHLFIEVKHRETHVVPQFWIASELIRGLLKVAESLQVLLVFEEGKSKVVEDLSSPLRV